MAEKGTLPAGSDNRIIANTLSTANYHCVDVQVQIKSRKRCSPATFR